MRISHFAMVGPFSRFSLGLSLLVLTLLVSLTLGVGGAPAAHAATVSPMQYDQFFTQDSVAQFRQWTLNGVKLQGDTLGRASLQLQPAHNSTLTCASSDID